MAKFPELLGTLFNSFQIGAGGSGARTLSFKNGFKLDLTATPTANRTITLPDVSGTLLLKELASLQLGGLSTDYPLLLPGGRLTASSSNTIADVTDGTTLYYLPYVGNQIPLWDRTNSVWVYRTIPDAGLSQDFSTSSPGPYDIYAYVSGGSAVLATQGWTNDTTRSRALTRKHGLWVLDFTDVATDDYRLWLGTVRPTGSSGSARLQDNTAQRLIFNAHNRVARQLAKVEATSSWSYNSSTYRPWNTSTANQVQILDGIGSTIVDVILLARSNSAQGQFGIGVDSTTTLTDCFIAGTSSLTTPGVMRRAIGLGYHYLQMLESVANSTSITMTGNSVHGIRGLYWC